MHIKTFCFTTVIALALTACTLDRTPPPPGWDLNKKMTEPISTKFVECYSGGKLIYKGKTTDPYVIYKRDGPWLDFEDADTLLKVYINADCMIRLQQDKYKG
jgi:hypothetical protein